MKIGAGNVPYTFPAPILCCDSMVLHIQHNRVHHHEVADAAQQDKDMEDLMAAKLGIITAGPLEGVEHASYGVHEAAQQ